MESLQLPRRKKRINSRKAGNRNELQLVEFFKKWTGWDFHRVPRSGGLHWAKDQRVTGDLVCPQEHLNEFPFSVETKKRNPKVSKKGKIRNVVDIGYLILDWDDCNLLDFWEQAVNDGLRADLEPIMFLRNGGMSKGLYYVFVWDALGKKLEKEFQISHLYVPVLGLAVTNSFELLDVDCHDLFKFVKENRTKVK